MQGQGIGWGCIQKRTPCGNLVIEVDPPPKGEVEGPDLREEETLEQLSLAEMPRVSVDEVGIRVLAHMALKGWPGVVEYLGDIAANPGPNKEMALNAMRHLAKKNFPKAVFFMGAYLELQGQNFPAYLWFIKAAQFYPEAARRAEALQAAQPPPPVSPTPEDRS